MTRVLTFKVPQSTRKSPTPALSDRSTTWLLIQQLGPGDETKWSPPTPKEEMVLQAFRMPPDSLLDVPQDSLPPPFAYHSAVNGEANYVTQPRLSVSKLLTDSWCELREYYEVYAGLPVFVRTRRMQAGSDYHKKLEDADHKVADTKTVAQLVREALLRYSPKEKEMLQQNEFAATLAQNWTEQVVVRLLGVPHTKHAREVFVHGFLDLKTGKLATCEEELLQAVLVNGVADIVKMDEWNGEDELTVLFPHTDAWGMAEVSSDVDLEVEGTFNSASTNDTDTTDNAGTTSTEIASDSVLNTGSERLAAQSDTDKIATSELSVSGAPGSDSLANSTVEDIAASDSIDSNPIAALTNKLSNTHISVAVLDLVVELPRAKERLDSLSSSHYLHVRDVKTRSWNSTPDQQLVVHAAHIQCMYYAQFLANLARNVDFAYASNLENAKRRSTDPDTPIGPALAVKLLLGSFGALARDMVRLASGEPIGYARFDNAPPSPQPYSLSMFVSEQEFREMLTHIHGDDQAVAQTNISALFGPWKTPLTLRYFAARAAQAFNIVQSFPPASVCVEYHNLKTRRIFAAKHAPFSQTELNESMWRAGLFWSGQRPPDHTDDRARCKNCDFHSRCSAINKELERLAGAEIYRLIEG